MTFRIRSINRKSRWGLIASITAQNHPRKRILYIQWRRRRLLHCRNFIKWNRKWKNNVNYPRSLSICTLDVWNHRIKSSSQIIIIAILSSTVSSWIKGWSISKTRLFHQKYQLSYWQSVQIDQARSFNPEVSTETSWD